MLQFHGTVAEKYEPFKLKDCESILTAISGNAISTIADNTHMDFMKSNDKFLLEWVHKERQIGLIEIGPFNKIVHCRCLKWIIYFEQIFREKN